MSTHIEPDLCDLGLQPREETPDEALPPVTDKTPLGVRLRSPLRTLSTGTRATWLPDVARRAGLKVALEPGWETRGLAFTSFLLGVIAHHTASRATSGNAPALGIVRDGRSDLPGPLSQIVLGRDGTVYVVASGRANHAGTGEWRGSTNGNGAFIGIEAENDGVGEPWSAAQMDAYVRLVAAILAHLKRDAGWCAGHKEYALPRGRKPDPTFDMGSFRSRVASRLAGSQPAPVPAPAPAPRPGVLAAPAGAIAYHGPAGAPDGYWIFAADGGVFAKGAAPYRGSLPELGVKPAAPVVDGAASADGDGYFLLGEDGGVFRFPTDAKGFGSLAGKLPAGRKAKRILVDPADVGLLVLLDDGAIHGLGHPRFWGSVFG